jgi:cytochrome c-type biogenesis protein CcmH/NrfF
MPYTTVILLVSIYGNRVLLFPSFQMNNLLLNAHILDFDVLIITTITITIFSTNVGKDISTNR